MERPATIALSAGSTIVWLDTETGHVRREIEIPQSDVQCLALSPEGQSIAVGFFSTLYPPARGFIRIFRLRDKQEIQTIESPCRLDQRTLLHARWQANRRGAAGLHRS